MVHITASMEDQFFLTCSDGSGEIIQNTNEPLYYYMVIDDLGHGPFMPVTGYAADDGARSWARMGKDGKWNEIL